MTDISDVIHQKRFTPFLQSIRDVVEDTTPDVIVVTGDTVPTPYVVSLKAFFGNLFPSNIPVIATLGNHEFWERSFEETLANARNQNADAPNVHILDAEPSVIIEGYNFVGGCLFFDGSMRWREDDDLLPWDGRHTRRRFAPRAATTWLSDYPLRFARVCRIGESPTSRHATRSSMRIMLSASVRQ